MKYVIVIFLSLFLYGCSQPSEIRYSELIELSKAWKEPKVAIWYYQGSDNKYHYFKFVDLGIKKHYVIIKSDYAIQEQILSTNIADWRVMPWGPLALSK